MAFYKKTPKGLLFDMIKAANPNLPFELKEDTCVVDKPVAITGTYNTRARVRGVGGKGITGVHYVEYNRLNLANLFSIGTDVFPTYTSFNATGVHQAISVINKTFGTNFTFADIFDDVMDRAGQVNFIKAIAIRSKPESLMYIGTGVVRYFRGRPALDEAVTVNSLDAYRHPFKAESKMSASLLTYGMDFSEHVNMLTVDASGMPQWAGFAPVLLSMGLPAWSGPLNGSYVSDLPTSSVPQANKAYDRVVVHTGIDEANVSGTAYYHYNS